MMKMRKYLIHTVLVFLLGVFFFFSNVSSLLCAPSAGGVLPTLNLPIPKDSHEKSYLGLSWGSSFKVPEIKAQVVVIEIFSMYCPFCQAEAPNINQLYEKIEGDPKLKDKIKLIGIGVGNSSFEVGTFKRKYRIQFPLFADGDFTIHKLLGEVRTPYFIGIKINSDGSHRVIFSQLGTIGAVDAFLATILKLSGIQ
jgi:thiol-disulfide isomerase/thioredoxin